MSFQRCSDPQSKKDNWEAERLDENTDEQHKSTILDAGKHQQKGSHIPMEILEVIAVYLPPYGLKTFRLASRAHASAGTRQLFASVQIEILPESLQALVDVCRNPDLARHVRELRLVPDVVKAPELKDNLVATHPSPTISNVRQMANSMPTDSTEGSSCSTTGPGHNPREGRVYHSQQEVLRHQVHLKLICSAVSFFSRLEVVRTVKYPDVSTRAQRQWRSDQGLPTFIGTKKISNKVYEDAMVRESGGHAARMLDAVLRGASTAISIPIQTIHTSKVNMVRIKASTLDRIIAGETLQHLQYLELKLRWNAPLNLTLEQDSDCMESELHTEHLLSRIPSLTALTLDLRDSKRRKPAYHVFDVGEVLWKCKWPKLQELRLRDVCYDSEAFTSFLRRHSKTLQILELKNPRLSDAQEFSEWQVFFEGLFFLQVLQEFDVSGHMSYGEIHRGTEVNKNAHQPTWTYKFDTWDCIAYYLTGRMKKSSRECRQAVLEFEKLVEGDRKKAFKLFTEVSGQTQSHT